MAKGDRGGRAKVATGYQPAPATQVLECPKPDDAPTSAIGAPPSVERMSSTAQKYDADYVWPRDFSPLDATALGDPTFAEKFGSAEVLERRSDS